MTQEIRKKPKVICEVGCNHKGSIDVAMDMIKTASEFCNVDVVKFQKRCIEESLTNEEYSSPHPVPQNSYGETYGKHREYLEFTIEQHELLKKECEKYKVIYSTSVWDLTSAKEVVELSPKLIKIPSAINTLSNVTKYLLENYKGEIHISLGMTTDQERENIINLIESYKRGDSVILYHCVSSYPVNAEHLYLLEIEKLLKYKSIVNDIGFSGHHRGISSDIVAFTLGANYFERHFTLDRTWKGTDHAASLEPDGMRKLVRDLSIAYSSLQNKPKDVLDIEVDQRKKLKKFCDD
jgi:N-acetylneuraminate synthase